MASPDTQSQLDSFRRIAQALLRAHQDEIRASSPSAVALPSSSNLWLSTTNASNFEQLLAPSSAEDACRFKEHLGPLYLQPVRSYLVLILPFGLMRASRMARLTRYYIDLSRSRVETKPNLPLLFPRRGPLAHCARARNQGHFPSFQNQSRVGYCVSPSSVL